MKRVGILAIVVLAISLPSCGDSAPPTPTSPTGPTAPASFTVTVTVQNANVATASAHREAPFITREVEFSEIYTFSSLPNAGANVTQVTETFVLGNGTQLQNIITPDPPFFAAGSSRTINRSFEYDADAACGANCNVAEIRVEATFSDELGNSGVQSATPVQVAADFLRNVNQGICAADATTLCLQGDRFRVRTAWRDLLSADPVPANTLNTSPDGTAGEFWFFNQDNFDLVVQVLDNCGGPDPHFWVFFSATTNVEFTINVTDTQTGIGREYFNPLGEQSQPALDTSAFATCPAPVPVP